MKKTKPKHPSAFPNTRKALRKEKRQQKKKHRLEHYLKKKEEYKPPVFTPGKFVRRPASDEDTTVEPKVKKLKRQPSVQDVLKRQLEKEKNDGERLKAQMDKQRKMILLKANEEEDKVIKKLEKQLGLKKSKNKNNFFADDGLDYLLEICDRTKTEQIVAAEKHLANVEGDSDFEEDLAAVTGKKTNLNKGKNVKNKTSNENNSDCDGSDIGSIEDSGSEDDLDDDIDETCKSYKNKMMKVKEIGSDGPNNDSIDVNESASEDDIDNDIDSEIDDEIDNIDSVEDGSEGDYSANDEDGDDVSENSYVEDKVNIKKNININDHNIKVNRHSDISSKSTEKENFANKTKSKTKDSNDDSSSNHNNKKNKVNITVKSKEKVISEEHLSKIFSDDEVSHLSGDDDDIDDVSSEREGDKNTTQKEKPDVWEDIYGRKRDKDGNIIKEEKGVYVPPHLRNKESSSDKELLQLKRQIKSILNKLTGTNLHWVCTSIENLYSTNSRNSVNTALTQLWTQAAVGPAATPDRMVAEHAALVAVLHANVGSEIGAHFLQALCQQFDALTQTPQPVEDKRLDNLVNCLAHLYTFKLYHAALLYDILARLASALSEKSIDCVLTALRCVGGALRKEDPAGLRAFIHDTQGRATALYESADSGSRVKFLMEVLTAVKNNNLNKIPNYDPSYVEQLRKQCRGVVRKGNYASPLNIRLEDLLKAEERGKWWVVGSAWEGARAGPERPAAPATAANQQLLELARKQRMNTDVRRSIFCVIMAAEDYMDAFEKLQHLGLRGQQEREVVHVLLACCLQERASNPFYSVLAMKLIDCDRKYQLSIQYAVWDKIKELDALSKEAVANLAQFLTYLILEKGQPLSILKIIQFSDLNKKTVRFMRQILLAIIMNADLQSALEVFHRISKPPKLHMFRESLRLFIQHFLVKNAGKKTSILSDEEMATLKERTAEVDRILTMHETKLRL